MDILTNILVGVVALLHYYFMALEMYFWTKPLGLKTFGMSEEKALDTKVLAANQGLYNGFLATGLVWGLLSSNTEFSFQFQVFFLSCMIVAGAYGALTVGRKILFVQALPASIALILLLITCL